MVTDAQYNAGRILINVKMIELGKLRKKLDRVRSLADKAVKSAEMPYTEDNMVTLMTHSMAALFSCDLVMMNFWMDAITRVGEDIQHCIKIELLRQHQAKRIGDIAERIGNQAAVISDEIEAIRLRISN
ncbi:hypothetical protein D3C85_273290 [compost metagenome]